MFLFLFLGLIELIGILLLYSIIHKYVVSKWRIKNCNINKNTVILITGAAFGVVNNRLIFFIEYKLSIINY